MGLRQRSKRWRIRFRRRDGRNNRCRRSIRVWAGLFRLATKPCNASVLLLPGRSFCGTPARETHKIKMPPTAKGRMAKSPLDDKIAASGNAAVRAITTGVKSFLYVPAGSPVASNGSGIDTKLIGRLPMEMGDRVSSPFPRDCPRPQLSHPNSHRTLERIGGAGRYSYFAASLSK